MLLRSCFETLLIIAWRDFCRGRFETCPYPVVWFVHRWRTTLNLKFLSGLGAGNAVIFKV